MKIQNECVKTVEARETGTETYFVFGLRLTNGRVCYVIDRESPFGPRWTGSRGSMLFALTIPVAAASPRWRTELALASRPSVAHNAA